MPSIFPFRPPRFEAGRLGALLVLAAALAGVGDRACAQDMEPRAYSAVPVDTNFLVGAYSNLWGKASIDPSLPITNVHSDVNRYDLGYSRSFDLLGRSASAAIVVPTVKGAVTGNLADGSHEATRSGFGDLAVRLATNLIGGPALSREEFIKQERTPTLGASVVMIAPTGQYDPQRLINIGNNRFAFKPEIGFSVPMDGWFGDLSAGAWLFTDNTEFFRGHTRGQDPILSLQAHGGYEFRPGLWLAADATYYRGGATTVDGIDRNDFKESVRAGGTVSVPIVGGLTLKVAGSTWVTHSNTGTFDVVTVALQFRWFDD